MKRAGLMLLALGMVALVGVAVAQEVTSVNVVGFSKIVVPSNGGYAMFSMMFDPVGSDPAIGGTNYIADVFGTNQLIRNNVSALADRLYKYLPASGTNSAGYVTYYQRTDGNFYQVGGVQVNPPVLAGDAFWVRSPAGAPAHEIILAGQVVEASTNLQQMVGDYQMLASPFSSDVGINDTGFKTSAGATPNTIIALADNIYVFTGSGYDRYGLKADGWHASTGYSTNAPSSTVLKLGSGFWYRARSGGWTWVETNKYLNNL
jgi:hypothetical protein